MYRGTTPTIKFHVNSDIDLGSMKQVWVTFKSQTREITKDISELEIDNELKTVLVTLSQEETLQFGNQNVSVQIRFLTEEGKAYASNIQQLKVNDVLKEGIIHGE